VVAREGVKGRITGGLSLIDEKKVRLSSFSSKKLHDVLFDAERTVRMVEEERAHILCAQGKKGPADAE
jgi:hypothetical protein